MPRKTKPAKPQIDKARQDYISQAEIAAAMELQHIMSVMCLNLRRRLMLGAAVEPGKWEIDADLSDPEFILHFDELQAECADGTNEPVSFLEINSTAEER